MKHSIIGLKDLRENTEDYINKIKEGRSFTVVRKSKPVFKIGPVDVWGDGGMWETVVDFRKIDPKGIPLDEVRQALREIKEEMT